MKWRRGAGETRMWRSLALAIAVGLFYYLGGRLGLLASVESQVVSLLWPPSGIAFAAAWMLGRPALAGVALGAFAVALAGSGSPAFALLVGMGNTLAAWAGCALLRRFGVRQLIDEPPAVLRFVIAAVLVAPLASATVGALALLIVGLLDISAAPRNWLMWWAGDATGVLIVAPALLVLSQLRSLRLGSARWVELALLLAATLVLWSQLFYVRDWPQTPPLAFLGVLPLVWAALRFGFALVCWVVLLLAGTAAIATIAGRGLFLRPDLNQSLAYLHAYMVSMAGVGLALGSAISAQRRSLRQLAASEERFRELADAAPVMIWMTDADARPTYFSRAWFDFLGRPPSDGELGVNWIAGLHPDDRPLFELEQRERLATPRPYQQEYRYRRGDGLYRWLLDTGKPRFDEAGEFLGFIGSCIDITARKEAETQLKGQARVLQELSLDTPQAQLLDDIARFVEETSPWLRCSILLVDSERGVLRTAAAPSLPSSFGQLVDGLPISDGSGSCGTAAAQRRLVVVEDVYSSPLWRAYRDVIRPFDHWLRACWSIPFFAGNGELLGTIDIYVDSARAPGSEELELMHAASSLCGLVVQRSREAQRLRESEAGLRATFQQTAIGVAELGADDCWLRVNQRFCEIAGYGEAELLGLDAHVLIHPDDAARDLAAKQRLLDGECDHVALELRYLRRGEGPVWVKSWMSLLRAADGGAERFILMVEDISERKRAEAEIERLALYDPLTGLPNRRLFHDRLQHGVQMAGRSRLQGALLFVDLDHFKHLNDARGHHAGDMLLKQVAERLRRCLRDEDTVARLGGDEFVVLLENLGADAGEAGPLAGAVAEKVRRALAEAFSLEEGTYEHHVHASIGVTLFPKCGETAEDLLKEADTAMYRAKAQGRNKVCFYMPEMQAAAELRLALERDLRAAIGDPQLYLLLQPQFDSRGEIVCAEALLRWDHPERGAVAPATFIPVAEESGLIVPLGEWVLQRACQLIRQLDGAENNVEIAINVSPRQFREDNFVERVRSILRDSGADPRRLILEITEGVVVADVGDAIAKMTLLEQMGIRLSIDDFGVGYSSLSYLKRLPLHELKIDRTFVSDLPGNANDVAIVETILAMARHLQLDVVAEGVENAAQLDFLSQRGCQFFQGYHCCRPLPVAELLPRLWAARPRLASAAGCAKVN